jgi:hypothetical protein
MMTAIYQCFTKIAFLIFRAYLFIPATPESVKPNDRNTGEAVME